MKNWKTWLSLCFVASGIYLLGGCQKGDLTLGSGIIAGPNLEVVIADTFTVKMSTIAAADSFVTSRDTCVYVGQWKDANTGTQTFSGYVTPVYAANDIADRLNVQYDSLVLITPLSYSYGDTTTTIKLSTHQLSGTLLNTTSYYNTNSARYEAKPIVERSFLPGVKRINTLRQRFPDAMGRSLYESYRNRTITDNFTLSNILPGFAFKATTDGNTILGLGIGSNRSFLRIYFHENSTIPTAESIDIALANTHFTQITNTFANTPLNALKDRSSSVGSEATNNMSFITQTGPLRTRIEFPYLDQLDYADPTLGVNRAELVFEVVRPDITRDNAVPPNPLYLYRTNSVNEPIGPVETILNSNSPVTANYVVDNTNFDMKDRYTFTITNYMNQVLRKKVMNAPLVILPPSSDANQSLVPLNFSRTALGNKFHPTDRVKLRLYFTRNN